MAIISRKLFHDIVTNMEKVVRKMNTSQAVFFQNRDLRLKFPKVLFAVFIYISFDRRVRGEFYEQQRDELMKYIE